MSYRYEIKNLKIVYEHNGENHISWSVENIVHKIPQRSFYYRESLERTSFWLKQNYPELFL
jgi:hypothetical protein